MAETTDITLGFVHSKTLADALTDSAIHQGKIYFPTDSTSIVKNGKEYGAPVDMGNYTGVATSKTSVTPLPVSGIYTYDGGPIGFFRVQDVQDIYNKDTKETKGTKINFIIFEKYSIYGYQIRSYVFTNKQPICGKDDEGNVTYSYETDNKGSLYYGGNINFDFYYGKYEPNGDLWYLEDSDLELIQKFKRQSIGLNETGIITDCPPKLLNIECIDYYAKEKVYEGYLLNNQMLCAYIDMVYEEEGTEEGEDDMDIYVYENDTKLLKISGNDLNQQTMICVPASYFLGDTDMVKKVSIYIESHGKEFTGTFMLK